LGTEVPSAALPTAPYTWPFRVLDIASIGGLGAFVALAIAQPVLLAADDAARLPEGAALLARMYAALRHALASFASDAHARMGAALTSAAVVAVHAVLLAYTFGAPRASGLVVALLCLARMQQLLSLYGANPLFLLASPDSAAAQVTQVSFMHRVSLTWATSAAEFAVLFEELRFLQRQLRGKIVFRLRVVIRSASEADKAELRRLYWFDPAIARSVVFAELDAAAELASGCDELLNDATDVGDKSINVFAYGPPWLADGVFAAFSEVREAYKGRVNLSIGGEAFA
jgi:hypothetical protein